MNYKLVATDMDGTLLDDNKEVSVHTRQVIERLRKQGILFSICTGRNITGIKKYREMLTPTGPIICNNGAIIMSPDGSELLYKKNMEPEDAREVYRLGVKYDVTLVIWSDNIFYTNRLDKWSNGYERFSGLKPTMMNSFDELLERGITKILFSGEPERIDEIRDDIDVGINKRKDIFLKDTTRCKSLPFFLEFFNSGVSKGKALEFIAEYCGINTSEIMAFGDAMNDMPMIQSAGFGVAMGNACQEIKDAASYVTSDNNHDGVAEAIEKLVL